MVVGLIQDSVRQKWSELCVSIRSDSAAERRGWRIERMLRVHRVKGEGPGFSSMSIVKYYIFQMKYTEAILSNSTRKLLWS